MKPPLVRAIDQRQLTVGKDLNGCVWLEIEGGPRITLTPDKAFKIADAMFKLVGIEMDYGYDNRRIG
jgi:hypothetical protein